MKKWRVHFSGWEVTNANCYSRKLRDVTKWMVDSGSYQFQCGQGRSSTWLFSMQWLWALSSLQLLSHVRLFVNPWTIASQASLSIINSWTLLKFMSIELVMPFNHLILCHPLLLLPSIFPSIKVFSKEWVLCIRWSKIGVSASASSPSNEYSGLISFRMDWLDLLAAQGTLKGLLQHHSSKASILPCSAFFTVQLSHPHMTTGKTIPLTRGPLLVK